MKKIAVIGAGVFGLEISIQLAKSGYSVELFELENEILGGSTSKSILRLHRGLHYPRDLATAEQSRIGYEQFLSRFPNSINFGFTNYYAVAKEGSKVTGEDFESFAKKAKIEVNQIPKESLLEIGFDSDRITSAFECDEGVIELEGLKIQFQKEIIDLGIQLHLSSRVTKLKRNREGWLLGTSSSFLAQYQWVVLATYGKAAIEIENVNIVPSMHEYHKTIFLEAELGMGDVGMTVVDGDFITLLPKGFGGTSFIYGPNPSVLAKYTGTKYPREWDFYKFDYLLAQKKILDRFNFWFPQAQIKRVINYFTTVRTISPNMQITDRRISSVEEISEGLYEVVSGKIDHCVEIARKVTSLIQKTDMTAKRNYDS